ncbi:hypothetical protein [Streptomyces sp. NPDC002159]
MAAWWTVARWFTAGPHPVLLLMLADLPSSLARTVDVKRWWTPYCLTEAAREHEHARRAQDEADSLRAQERSRRPAHRPQLPAHGAPHAARLELEVS